MTRQRKIVMRIFCFFLGHRMRHRICRHCGKETKPNQTEALNLDIQTVMYGVLRSTPMGLVHQDDYNYREIVNLLCKIDKAITKTAKKHGLKEYEAKELEDNLGQVWDQMLEVKK